MPKYVIERSIPGVGGSSAQDLQAISQKSCSVLEEMGPRVQWVESYVTQDKVYCVYIAANEQLIEAVNATGDVFLSHTRLKGRLALRVAIGHLRTTEAHVRRVWEMLQSHAAVLQSSPARSRI